MMGRQSSQENVKSRHVSPHMHSSSSYTVLDIEIDRGLDACGPVLCSSAERDIPLYKYSEIPEFLQGNPYVVKGYRAFLPFSLCLGSLFVWSNETINIWSHLLGFITFAFFMVYDNVIVLPNLSGNYADHLIITVGLLCFQFCLLCSTGFHMFACHSERASRRWLAVDLAGISIGLIGCYLPAVHYAFYCLSIWRDVYLLVICVLSAAVLFVQCHPYYYSSTWFRHKLLIYTGLVAYGIIPTIHWVYLNGGLSSPIVQMFIPKVTVMYMLAILAFLFYLTKFPERFFPGHFDYIASSHQWWHMVVLAAFMWWHHSGQELLKYRTSHQCPA